MRCEQLPRPHPDSTPLPLMHLRRRQAAEDAQQQLVTQVIERGLRQRRRPLGRHAGCPLMQG